MAEASAEQQVAAPAPAVAGEDNEIDTEIQELEQEMEFMEKETQQVKDMSENQEKEGDENNVEIDKRSVYVGNVDYGATPEELQEHFKSCGSINRITIMVDKYTACPKGFAYMEFASEEAVKNAVLLNDSLFRGRQLKVLAKRTNLPGYNKGKGKGKVMFAMKGKGKGKKGGYMTYAPTWVPKGKGKAKGYSPY